MLEVKDSSALADTPDWSVSTGVGLWMLSVALVLGSSLVASLIWMLYRKLLGLPSQFTKEAFMTSEYLLILIGVSFLAHLLTLAACYLVVTASHRHFLQSLGWHWHPRFRFRHCITMTLLVMVFSVVVSQLLPNDETDFEKIMRVSASVRVATALLAVLTAPIVEEVIYRGVLYAPIRKAYGAKVAVAAVSLLFVAVHVPQYWGGWGVLASLALLSTGLTILRAATGSLLPCVTVHTLFNAINGFFIVMSGFVEKQ